MAKITKTQRAKIGMFELLILLGIPNFHIILGISNIWEFKISPI